MSAQPADKISITDMRLALKRHGYIPVPISGHTLSIRKAGKCPLHDDWRTRCPNASDDEIRSWCRTGVGLQCPGTGLVTGELVGVDLDVPLVPLARGIEKLAVDMLGVTPLRRVGNAPKTVLAYRTDAPFAKLATPELFIGEIKVQVEILGEGQQFVAYGIHPETKRDYEWTDREPLDVRACDLPITTEERVRAFVDAAEAMLRAHGAKEKPKEQTEPAPKADSADTFGRNVNNLALESSENIGKWMLAEFPTADEQNNGAWRVEAKDLGQEFEEALSVHPKGARDFGAEQKLTPIDVLMKFKKMDFKEAAFKICEHLGVDPKDLGWDEPLEYDPYTDEERPWPVMGDEAYHGLLGEIVRAMEPHTEADPVSLLIQLLVSFGSMIGRRCYMEIGSVRHHGNLFVVLVGDSATARKGTSWADVEAFLKGCSFDDDWLIKCVSTNGVSTGEGMINQVRDPVETVGKDGKKQITDEGVRDKRRLIFEAEYSRVLKAINRQDANLSAVLRVAWDGGHLQISTRNSPLQATAAHISNMFHVTPVDLTKHMTETEAANGSANRNLYLNVRRSKLLAFGDEDPVARRAKLQPLQARFKAVFEKAAEREPSGDETSAELRITLADAETRTFWRATYEAWPKTPGMAGQIIARGQPQVLRLAMLYALLDRETAISLVHLRAALALWRYCEDSVEHVWGDSLGDPVADEVLRLLKQTDGVTKTEIGNTIFGKHYDAPKLTRALRLLVKLGKARFKKFKTKGRPKEVWWAIKKEK